MNDWFYRELSGKVHSSLNGFAWRAGFLFSPSNAERERLLDKTRSDGVFTTITLLLRLLSEVEIEFDYGLADRLKYVWGIVYQYWGEAEELYRRRYAGAL